MRGGRARRLEERRRWKRQKAAGRGREERERHTYLSVREGGGERSELAGEVSNDGGKAEWGGKRHVWGDVDST